MALPAEVVAPVLIDVRPGHRVAVRRRGEGGVPLLLIHGFPCTSRIWSHNLIPLAQAGFDAVAPDLRGYGDSDFTPDDFYDLNAFSTDLVGLFDALIAELGTPEQRRRYVGEFYGHRMWCPPDAFDEEDLAFLTEPFADAARLRASFADYEIVMGTRPLSAPEMLDRPVRQQALVLIGADQVTIGDHVEARCALAFPGAVGPFWVKGAGHFLPWERPETVNRAVRAFCGDLLKSYPGKEGGRRSR
ncbi:alpha/beta hydrolase [Kribbella sandramycini]|uniref:Alpha/beta hydrolase n=1 Tax=Kribbella sandramycini TaxID=60450 RepID=A0A7Y4NYB0_9ACTN|nr:alpha/beta hydrolase [Kribbella sandramycini]MBB6569849.1 pimeloyl-ACP methyl ester carboxylesterase [Kribbella sandramycini]NOL40326.1 alpha/beta hydrolase [Kribbella sandramycini]